MKKKVEFFFLVLILPKYSESAQKCCNFWHIYYVTLKYGQSASSSLVPLWCIWKKPIICILVHMYFHQLFGILELKKSCIYVFNNVLTYVLRWYQACLLYFFEKKDTLRSMDIWNVERNMESPTSRKWSNVIKAGRNQAPKRYQTSERKFFCCCCTNFDGHLETYH